MDTQQEAQQSLATLTLPTGYVGSVQENNDGYFIVRVDGPNDWYLEYMHADQALWAQQQINLVSQ